MLLRELLHTPDIRDEKGSMDRPVQGLACDSRRVRDGYVFFALSGQLADGHDFVGDAVTRGAAAVVLQRPVPVPPPAACIQVSDTRRAMARAAAAFYGHPSRGLVLVGVTGTNGKTTVTYLLEAILGAGGDGCGVIGTISQRYAGWQRPSPLTTPESIDIEELLSDMLRAEVRFVAMEVSSHALDLRRVDGLDFDAAVFTNLSRDHLDYHPDMESYFLSKARLFTDCLPASTKEKRVAVINADDPRGRELSRLAGDAGLATLTYGRSPRWDIHPLDVESGLDGLRGTLACGPRRIEFESGLIGEVNLENILAAAGTAWALGLDPRTIADGIARLHRVPGRLEPVPNDLDRTLVVDYAHTPDALAKAIRTLRLLTRGRLITVFGCGGDRDAGKRPLMGEIAASTSDCVVLTSDNPRGEEPVAIIRDIEEGVRKRGMRRLQEGDAAGQTGYWVEPDRRCAIRLGVSLASPGDVVLVAGKGHEDYQIQGDRRLQFDDRQVLQEEAGVLAATATRTAE